MRDTDLLYMLIYKATNLKNNKIYIGQTKNSLEYRKHQHEREALNPNRLCVYFHNALNKYGFDSFKWEILKDNVETQEELDNLEIFYINFYNSSDKNIGYNLKLGGNSGGICTEEARKHIGESTKKKWADPIIAGKMRKGLESATKKWQEICKSKRIKHICPVCGREFETANFNSHKYCSYECAKKDLSDVFIKNLEKATKANKDQYQQYKSEKYNEIVEWVKSNTDCLINIKWNRLSFLKDLCGHINVKDCRTLAKLLDVSNRKQIVKRLIQISENIC